MPPPDLPLKYQDVTPLAAAGGMGALFRATLDGRPVVVKVPKGAASDLTARFLDERRILTNLEHPNFVRIVEIGGPPDVASFYYAMEYLSGGTLAEMAEEFRPPHSAARLLLTLARAIAHLHVERQWVHRDLKPTNILFAEDGTPRIADFGLARDKASDATSTQSGDVLGTEAYMSPEQRRGLKYAEEPTDIYALGLILYEVLTGQLPPPGGKDWRPSRHTRAVRGDLDQIVLGCVQEDPERRYTATALAEALEGYLGGKWPSPPSVTVPSYPKAYCGELPLNIVRLPPGGSGRIRYKWPDGVRCTSTREMFSAPPDANDVTEDWLRQKIDHAAVKGILFEDKPQPRLVSCGPGGTTDDDDELPYPLVLQTARTHYFATQVTHFGMDMFLPDTRTIRDCYAGEHNDLSRSRLANPLAVNLSVVTTGGDERFIFTTIRGKMVGGNAEFDPVNRVPAVSGTGHPDIDKDEQGNYDPFKAGIREAYQEVLGDYIKRVGDEFVLDRSQITFFGVARTGKSMFPFLYGELRIPLTRDQYLTDTVIDDYDVYGKEGRPFTIEAVTAWIRELYHRYDAEKRLLSGPSHTGIFSLYQSLIHEFQKPDEIDRIKSLLPAKPI